MHATLHSLCQPAAIATRWAAGVPEAPTGFLATGGYAYGRLTVSFT